MATRLEVWDGRSGFASALVDVALPVDHSTTSSARWHFGLGDHDVDGVNDLFVMSTGSLVSVQVIDGASRFSATTRRMRSGMSAERGDLLAVADYDGDGRDDLYRIGQDRSIEVRLGGLRGAGEDLDGWFRAWEGWKPGRGCVDVASGVVGAPAVDAAGGVVAAVYPGKDRGGRIMTVGGGAVDDSPLPWGMAPAAVALGPGEAIAVTGTTRNGTGRTLVSGGGAAPSDLRHKGTPVDLAWQGDTAQVLLAVDGGAVIDGVRRGRAFREVDVEDLDPTAIAVAGDHLVRRPWRTGDDRSDHGCDHKVRSWGRQVSARRGSGRHRRDTGCRRARGRRCRSGQGAGHRPGWRSDRRLCRTTRLVGGRCDGTVARWPRRRCGDPKVRRFGLRLPARPRRREGYQAGGHWCHL